MIATPNNASVQGVCEPEAAALSSFQLTVFESRNKPLNKTITLESGKLKKVANGQFSDGQVRGKSSLTGPGFVL
jgi:hypothetical protein